MTNGSTSGNKTQPNRLAGGGIVNRRRTLSFTFDGVPLTGHPGDTLASALLANDIKLTGRSFKYHRPRGILSASSEEPNALVELRSGAFREPNTKATVTELYDGLEAKSQNRWPTLRFDALAINSLLSPVLVAGFYYKTFMWPASFWEKFYEPSIRRAAGLGRAADHADPDPYEKSTAFCDLLVIGAGPGGLMAALTAARSGLRVILADENFALGGRCLDDGRIIGDEPASSWVTEVEAELATLPEVRLLRRTTVFGTYDGGTYGAVERVTDHFPTVPKGHSRQRLWRIVAKHAILAAGATERPIVFGGNDRPGVMLAGAVRSYINKFAVLAGKRALVFANNDSAASTVLDLMRAGAAVEALIDSRLEPDPNVLSIAKATGVKLIAGGVVLDAIGGHAVTGAVVRTEGNETIKFNCDLIAMSGGWNPNIQLTTHLNGRPQWNANIAAFTAGPLPSGMTVIAAASGQFGLKSAIASGAQAGVAAAQDAGFKATMPQLPKVDDESSSIEPLWRVSGTRGKAFVDFQNDVAVSDVDLAEREGFRAVEHLKRYTTLGMATDQGRTANVNGLAIMAELTGKSIPETGTTTARPPYTPVTIGALAGHHRGMEFKPIRLPPSYAWAKEQGAVFIEAGLWLRPQYFPLPGETDGLTTVTREVKAVRGSVGICDVSTLGKIDIQGSDAAEFLDRVYINHWKSLPVGRARYGAMLREDGVLMDDGTTARIGDDQFFMTTTTANAAKVLQHLEWCHQWLWPDLDVQMVSATDQWAQYAVAGPNSRELLRKIVDPEFDIADKAFPYMAAGEVTICRGTKARLYRLSFSGERAFEIGVPARFGDALMRRLMDVGKEFKAIAYGTDALGVMRIEKGHVGGPEMNGTTTAKDVGLGRMMSAKKDFIGRVLSGRPALVSDDRPSLVGFRPVDRRARLRGGAHLLARGARPSPANDEGYMTSVAYSPMADHWIALGLLVRGPERHGEVVRAYDPIRNEDTLVEVVPPVFYDPEGDRLRG